RRNPDRLPTVLQPRKGASWLSREKTQNSPSWSNALPYKNSNREPAESSRRLGSSRGLSPDCEGCTGEVGFVTDRSRLQSEREADCDPEDRARQDTAHNALDQRTRAYSTGQTACAESRA